MDFTTLISQDVMIKLNSHFKRIRETNSSATDRFTFKDYIDESEVSTCCLENTANCCHGDLEKKFLKSAAIVFLQVSYLRFS